MVETSRLRERHERVRTPRQARHSGTGEAPSFTRTFAALGKLAYEGAQVSASVVDLNSGRTLIAIDDRIVLPTASIGKILLLIEVSARLTSREFSGYGILDKTALDSAGDSGIWQHLQAPSLPVADLATLVGSTSDNLATNVLLRQVGLAAVRARTESLGLMRTALLDLVRDSRGPVTRRNYQSAPPPNSAGCSALSPAMRSWTRSRASACLDGCRSTAISRWSRVRSGSTRWRIAGPSTTPCS